MESEKQLKGFNKLFVKNVPHLLEGIFFSLDYPSFRECLRVSKKWYKLLTSETIQKKAKLIFHDGLLEDEKKLCDAASEGNALEIRVVVQLLHDIHPPVKKFCPVHKIYPIASQSNCKYLSYHLLKDCATPLNNYPGDFSMVACLR